MATGPQKVSHLPPPRDHAGSTNSPARPISSSPPALRANGSMKPAGGACWGHPLRGMLGACWGHPLCQNGQKWVVPSGPYRSLTRRRPSNPRRVFQINDYFVILETSWPWIALTRETNSWEGLSMPLDPLRVKSLFQLRPRPAGAGRSIGVPRPGMRRGPGDYASGWTNWWPPTTDLPACWNDPRRRSARQTDATDGKVPTRTAGRLGAARACRGRNGGSRAGEQGPSADALIGSVIAGRYKIREEIGEGGMGSVYLAEQTQPVKRRWRSR